MERVRSILWVIVALVMVGDTWAAEASKIIKVGISPVVSSAGVFIAHEKGYFKEQGLAVELIPFRNSGAAMTALLSKGELDVGGGNITAGLWAAKSEGIDIRLVADKGHVDAAHDYIALVVRSAHVQSGRYRSFKDLKGFKLGLTAGGGVSQEIAADRFLKKGGLKLEDVTFLKMSYGEMQTALKNGTLDATVQLEPYLTQGVLDGFAINVAGVSQVYPAQPSAALFYSPKFAKERKDDGVKFMVAYLKAVRDYEHSLSDSTLKKEITEILKRSTDPLTEQVWSKMTPVGLNPDGYLNVAALVDDVRWYQSNGYLQKSPAEEQLVDHSFVDKALEIIGRFRK